MEKDEPLKFSRQWFLNIKGEWQRNLDKIPEFDIAKLKTYLTESRNKTFDKEGMRAYKSLKAFKFFEEGYVQKISSLEIDNLFLVRAEVMASMAQKVYRPYISLSNGGDVQGGSCDCVAGQGEACSHIAALLFALDDFIAKGLKDLPDDQTKTDKLCSWNKPAKRKVEPKTIHNIRVVKQEHGKVSKERETLAALNFDPRHTDDKERDISSINKLLQSLETSNPTCGFVKYNKTLDVDRQPAELIQDYIMVKHCTDLDLPASIQDIQTACTYLKDSLTLDSDGIDKLEKLTRGQSNSFGWHNARRYRLTASNFHKIGFRRKGDPTNLLKNMLYNKPKQTAAMAFGLKQEDIAISRFKDKIVENGEMDIKVEKRGLIVDSDRCYLGASVDGIVKIGGQSYVLEIKNPASTWKMDIVTAARKLASLKVDENNTVNLNQRHEYYSQIQGQMGILQIPRSFFVLCTETDIHIELVSFSVEFWQSLLGKLDAFYDNIFLPEIVYPSVKYGLPALDLRKLDM